MIRALSSSACSLTISTWLRSAAIRCCTASALRLASAIRSAVRTSISRTFSDLTGSGAPHAIELLALDDHRQAVGVIASIAAERRGRLEDRGVS